MSKNILVISEAELAFAQRIAAHDIEQRCAWMQALQRAEIEVKKWTEKSNTSTSFLERLRDEIPK